MRRFDLVLITALAGLLASAPACDSKKPTPTTTPTPVEKAKPAADEAKPAADEAKPATDEAKPAADEAKPAADEAKPAADEAKPATDEAKPAADEAKPATDAAKVSPIPDGYWTVTPGVIVDDADAAMAFYVKAFGATELFKMPGPDGKTLHGEVLIGDTHLMVGTGMGEASLKSPTAAGGTTGSLQVAVKDVDATFKQAVAAGAKVAYPVEDQFWGHRHGSFIDPFGHLWGVGTAKVVLTPAQMGEAAMHAFSEDRTKAAAAVKAVWAKGTPSKTYRSDGYNDVTASLHIKDAAAIDAFYVKALGAEKGHSMPMPDGSLMHAQVTLGNSVITFSQESEAFGTKSPATLGATTVSLYVYVKDVDAAMKTAEAAKAEVVVPTNDTFWGDRMGGLKGPSGHMVSLATHTKNVTPEEMGAALKAMGESHGEGADKKEGAGDGK